MQCRAAYPQHAGFFYHRSYIQIARYLMCTCQFVRNPWLAVLKVATTKMENTVVATVSALVSIPLTLLSVIIERVGPEVASYGISAARSKTKIVWSLS